MVGYIFPDYRGGGKLDFILAYNVNVLIKPNFHITILEIEIAFSFP